MDNETLTLVDSDGNAVESNTNESETTWDVSSEMYPYEEPKALRIAEIAALWASVAVCAALVALIAVVVGTL